MGLVKAGVAYRRIAGQLSVSVGTVASDVKAVMRELRRQQLEDAEDARALDMARLDDAIRTLYPSVPNGNLGAVLVC